MTVLVTGGRGYLGSRLARHFASDAIVTIRGEPDPLATVDPAPITGIVHAAATTRFDIDAETAQRDNVAATEAVVALARRCPRLQSFVHLSTVYAAGLATGPIQEAPLTSDREFANNYERSKWQAEQVVADQGDGLPWRIARLATVVADDASGAVTQHNAFHRTLDLWFHGLLPVLPGDPQATLPVITGRFATAAIIAVLDPKRPTGVYHVAPTASPTLDEVRCEVTAAFESDPTYRRRRVERPLFVDAASFDLLAGAVSGFRGSLAGQAVAALRPFARQLYAAKQFETGRLVTDISPVDPLRLIAATARHLVLTRWGRRDGQEVPRAAVR